MACKTVPGATRVENKGSKVDDLSSRFARATITPGNMDQRYRNNYAKKPPKSEQYGMPVAMIAVKI